MRRKAGNLPSLRRRRPFRLPRQYVLIVCEGEKTEPNYFECLRRELALTSVEVEIAGGKGGRAPISVVDLAVRRKKDRGGRSPEGTTHAAYDAVWCVMDVESPVPHESLSRALDKAKGNRLRVALSNPTFEYWYLLHFVKTSALMPTNHDVMRALKKHYPAYQKSDRGIFAELFPRTETGIRHAEQVLKEKHYGEDLRECNPSTHVHRVVAQLRTIAGRPYQLSR